MLTWRVIRILVVGWGVSTLSEASLAFGDGALPTTQVTLFGGKGGVGKPEAPDETNSEVVDMRLVERKSCGKGTVWE